MRIAIITPNPPNEIGGVERFVFYLKNALEGKKYEVDIFDHTVLKNNRKILISSIAEQIKAYRIGKEFMKHKKQYDLVISNGMFGWNVRFTPAINIYHGIYAGVAEGMKKVISFPSYVQLRYLNGMFERHSGNKKINVAVSNQTKREIERYYHLIVDYVIMNGIDINTFKPRENKEELREFFNIRKDVFLGMFVDSTGYRKGKDIIENIAKKLKPQTKILCLSKNRFDNPNILRFRNVPHEDLPKLYSACDFFIFPSRYEGCSIAVIEAMASGLPPILSNVGHTSDIAKNKVLSNFVIQGLNVNDYLEKIAKLKESTDLYEQVSKEARNYVIKNNSLEGFNRNYLKLISDVMDHESAK